MGTTNRIRHPELKGEKPIIKEFIPIIKHLERKGFVQTVTPLDKRTRPKNTGRRKLLIDLVRDEGGGFYIIRLSLGNIWQRFKVQSNNPDQIREIAQVNVL